MKLEIPTTTFQSCYTVFYMYITVIPICRYGKVPLRKPSLLSWCPDSLDKICRKGLKVEAPCDEKATSLCVWKNFTYQAVSICSLSFPNLKKKEKNICKSRWYSTHSFFRSCMYWRFTKFSVNSQRVTDFFKNMWRMNLMIFLQLFDEVELFVPVGDLDDYPLVSIVTLLLGCAGCIYILSILSMTHI